MALTRKVLKAVTSPMTKVAALPDEYPHLVVIDTAAERFGLNQEQSKLVRETLMAAQSPSAGPSS